MGKIETDQTMPVKALPFAVKATKTRGQCVSDQSQRTFVASTAVPETSTQVKPLAVTNESVSASNRVVVVEQNASTRHRLQGILQSARDFELAGDFSHPHEALNHIPRLRPNLLLLGLRKRDADGIKGIRLLKRILIGLKIIMVMGAGDMDALVLALQAGADHCLVKPVRAVQCLATLRSVVRGPSEIGPQPHPWGPVSFCEAKPGKCGSLNRRELEVMRCLAEGLFYKEIADKVGVSYAMVHKLQHNAFQKLHARNRWEATRVWLDGSNAI